MNLIYRDIDQKVSNSIARTSPMKLSNTQVTIHDGNISVSLHGNTIMTANRTDIATTITFSTCGWHTQTTRNRLNAALDGLHCLGYAKAVSGFKIKGGLIHAFINNDWQVMGEPLTIIQTVLN